MSSVKFRIIEEVRKRPILWDFQNIKTGRNHHEISVMWIEIGEKVGVDVTTCKRIWTKLRAQFSNHAYRVSERIANAKQHGVFDPNKKYYSWPFFDALKFVVKGRLANAKFIDLNFQNDSDIEIVENNTVDHKESQASDSTRSSYRTEIDNDIEIVGCDNSGQMRSEKQNCFENKYESDNEVEIVEDNNFYQTQSGQENYFENTILPKENDNSSSIIPVDDESNAEDTNFKSYTVSLNSCVLDNKFATVSKDNSALKSCSFKEEPELQIDPEIHFLENADELQEANALQERKSPTVPIDELSNHSENSNLLVESNANEHYDSDDLISNQPGTNDEERVHNDLSTLPEKHNSNSPGLNDEDYGFLYSFLSQTKVMTQLQNMEFRVNMKNLLVDIFPASASVNILEKQLLLPEDSDPDRKFLISFWPFLNSMSLTQNLQFRAKMANLVSQILSNEEIL